MTMEAPCQKEEIEMVANQAILKVGPFQSSRRDDDRNIVVWDEKGKAKLSQMFISHDNDYIRSLAFQYIEDGQLTLSPIFGSKILDGPNFHTVTFMKGSDTDNEYITKVSGFHGMGDGLRGRGLRSLTIETNEATYGPFGRIVPKYASEGEFNYSLGHSDQFGGFHGTSSPEIITSIGIYLKPIQDLGSIFKRTNLPID